MGVLKRYHAVLILSESDVKSVWDSLVKISRLNNSMPQVGSSVLGNLDHLLTQTLTNVLIIEQYYS